MLSLARFLNTQRVLVSLFSEDFRSEIWHRLIFLCCDNCGPTQRNAGRSLPSRRLAAEKSYSPRLLDLLARPRPHLLTSKRKYPLWKLFNSIFLHCLASSSPFDLKTQISFMENYSIQSSSTAWPRPHLLTSKL